MSRKSIGLQERSSSRPRLRSWRVTLLLSALLLSPVLAYGSLDIWQPPSTNQMQDLNPVLESWRERLDLPALAGAVVSSKSILAAGAVGRRRADDETKVQLTDKFHIGSCTKSMTALLAALLAEKGLVEWKTEVGSVFPEWEMPEATRKISLDLLIQNRSGITGKPSEELWSKAWELTGPGPEQRREFLQELLKADLAGRPGESYLYSNSGYALAGAMLERRARLSWEELMRKHIFSGLQMESAGFGPPSFPGKVDQPWGHVRLDGKAVPAPRKDNPLAIAPAGAVHCSILDLARYAAFHLQAARGDIPELKGWRSRLYNPPNGFPYAGGWLVVDRAWAGGKALTHAGSNTMFYTVVWIAPVRGIAFVLSTNIGGEELPDQMDQVTGALITQFLQQPYP